MGYFITAREAIRRKSINGHDSKKISGVPKKQYVIKAGQSKPEINVLLNPTFVLGTVREPWTEYYAIYPNSGKELYGESHSCCGIAVGRNGVAIWEHASGNPVLVLAAPVNISGWSHITLVYRDGIPAVFVNGKQVQSGKKSNYLVHPPADKAFLNEGASYYNGDMSKPVVLEKPLTDDDVLKFAAEKPLSQPSTFAVEMTGDIKPALLIKENGNYILRKNDGATTNFNVGNINNPIEIAGPWKISFPSNAGVPSHIILPRLTSLHEHKDDAVKYFSGTSVYTTSFDFHGSLKDKHWLLDLGRVEVIAELSINGKNFGIIWKRPYSADITTALKPGINIVEIKVTNLWPNRLIGDEQIPDPDKFSPGGGSSGLESVTKGNIEQLPEWYIEGKPKPANGRVTFTTWKHFSKDSPLLESGLIGPVMLQPGVIRLL